MRLPPGDVRGHIESLARLLFERSRDAVILVSMEGVIADANPAALDLFNLERSDLGMAPIKRLYPEFGPRQDDAGGRAYHQFDDSGRTVLKRGNGETFTGFVSVTHLRGKQGQAVGSVVIVRDVSEPTASAEVLREEKERAQQYLEVAGTVFIALDTCGIVTLVNKQGCKLLGYDTSALLGKDWFATCIPEGTRTELRKRFDEYMKGTSELAEYHENPVLTLDGAERMIGWHNALLRDKSGAITGLLSSGIDVTDRCNAQRALYEVGQRYESFLDGVQGIAFHGNVEQAPVFFRGTMEEITGYAEEDFTRGLVKWADVIHPDDLPSYRQGLLTGQANSPTPRDREYRVISRDGSVRWVREIVSTAAGAPGPPDATHGVLYDITVLKRAENHLLSYQERLRELAVQSALTEERERRRLSVQLHDLVAQPLALTRIKLDAMKARHSQDDMTRLIADVRLLTDEAIRQTRSLTTELSPQALFGHGFQHALEWLCEQMTLRFGLPARLLYDGGPLLLAEDVRLTLFQSVRELMTNAVKHAQAKAVTVGLRRLRDQVEITVSDDGIGFKNTEVSAPHADGAAFGLFSVRDRLDLLGGGMDIESVPGSGSKITLRAPLCAPLAADTSS